MARLVRRILVGQIDPRGAGAQDEQNAVEHFTSAAPRAATAVFVSFRFWNQWVQQSPLGIGEVSQVGHSSMEYRKSLIMSTSESQTNSSRGIGSTEHRSRRTTFQFDSMIPSGRQRLSRARIMIDGGSHDARAMKLTTGTRIIGRSVLRHPPSSGRIAPTERIEHAFLLSCRSRRDTVQESPASECRP